MAMLHPCYCTVPLSLYSVQYCITLIWWLLLLSILGVGYWLHLYYCRTYAKAELPFREFPKMELSASTAQWRQSSPLLPVIASDDCGGTGHKSFQFEIGLFMTSLISRTFLSCIYNVRYQAETPAYKIRLYNIPKGAFHVRLHYRPMSNHSY